MQGRGALAVPSFPAKAESASWQEGKRKHQEPNCENVEAFLARYSDTRSGDITIERPSPSGYLRHINFHSPI
jgi:hypothetical protein